MNRILTSLVLVFVCSLAAVPNSRGAPRKQLALHESNVALSTIPRHVYKAADRIDSKEKNECWYFHVVINDTQTRALDPLSASIELYSGSKLQKRLELGAAALSSQRGVTFKKNAGLDESFDLRQHFCEPAALSIDRARYQLELRASGGKKLREAIEIPILTYVQKTKLVFPVRGNFVVVNGSVVEGGHHEWSQLFAYDIIGLDPQFAMITGDGAKNEQFVGWGREVIAPASGVVSYSRNDVPDNVAPGVIDMAALQGLPEQPWPMAGNVVVIDHGDGEYSVLGHMQQGSVRVKRGDRVEQSDIVGLLGNSGHSQGPHLHYHLMNGALLFRSDGLPSRFENVEGGIPTQGAMSEAN